MRTNGGRYTVSDFAVVHSDEGKFKHSLIYKDNKHITVLVLASGGHGQKGMDLLDKYRIEYHITKTYSNGVRIGEEKNKLGSPKPGLKTIFVKQENMLQG